MVVQEEPFCWLKRTASDWPLLLLLLSPPMPPLLLLLLDLVEDAGDVPTPLLLPLPLLLSSTLLSPLEVDTQTLSSCSSWFGGGGGEHFLSLDASPFGTT